MEEEVKFNLSILVEVELYRELKSIEETSNSKEELDISQQRQIIRFINELPEEYKTIPDRDEIIARILNTIGMNTSWGEKKLEEIEMTKRMNKGLGKGSPNKNSAREK